MIYRLMRVDGDLSTNAVFAGILVLSALGIVFLKNPSLIVALPPMVIMVQLSFAASASQRRDGQFVAALPVEPRHIFFARVAVMMMTLWLPVLVATAACVVARASIPSPFLAAAAYATPLALGIQGRTIRRLSRQTWLGTAFTGALALYAVDAVSFDAVSVLSRKTGSSP